MDHTYTLLDHTADLRLRISGSDPADLFKNAGLALFDMIVDPPSAPPEATIELAVDGEDYADLMVNYLRELLYLWTGSEKVVTLIDIDAISATAVSARVTVGGYRPDHHAVIHEIKAVTYHQIDVAGGPAGWQSTVVLDI
ncbi:MAG TPA: archease [Desulfosarcina sp.]|nr:archease [Desulfosarcina sp.]